MIDKEAYMKIAVVIAYFLFLCLIALIDSIGKR